MAIPIINKGGSGIAQVDDVGLCPDVRMAAIACGNFEGAKREIKVKIYFITFSDLTRKYFLKEEDFVHFQQLEQLPKDQGRLPLMFQFYRNR